ncbi:MAG: class I SAM-dependent methyltransferase, partial [Leptospiraceae bacterium]|nr:class I SAM-dependent methyltransferase [Leptospiraceae bacterium]
MTENIYNPEFVKGLFNRMSSSYERMNYITSFGFSIRWRRQFLDSIPSTEEKVEIMDLLTGMGENWESVRRKFQNANVSALDFSEEMIKSAELKNKKHFNRNILVLQEDILQNTLPSNHYDIVICAFGLKTFNPEQLKTLAIETNRILKPGGKFSFVEVSKPESFILKFFYGFY